MKPFKKLDINLDAEWILSTPHELIQTTDIGKVDRYKYASWGDQSIEPTPLLMYSLTEGVEKKIIDMLPDSLKEKEVPKAYIMKMIKLSDKPNMLYPHVDRGRRTAINFYLACGDETTQFYEANEEEKTLSLIDQFCAKEGECWALDVSKPHSVLMSMKKERIGLSLSYRKTRYSDIIGRI
jgi:hypothetical protein